MFCYAVRLFLINSLDFEATVVNAQSACPGVLAERDALSRADGVRTCRMRELLTAP
jgi:hypothetical protein